MIQKNPKKIKKRKKVMTKMILKKSKKIVNKVKILQITHINEFYTAILCQILIKILNC